MHWVEFDLKRFRYINNDHLASTNFRENDQNIFFHLLACVPFEMYAKLELIITRIGIARTKMSHI
jgi:hypothetical protein